MAFEHKTLVSIIYLDTAHCSVYYRAFFFLQNFVLLMIINGQKDKSAQCVKIKMKNMSTYKYFRRHKFWK